MYALINLPGSRHFEYFGPKTKAECEAWLEKRVTELLQTELLSSTLPRQIISNREAESMRYRDGTRVCRMENVDNSIWDD